MSMPEQYVKGTAYFMDFEFRVDKDTFIPRPETELLVEKTIETVMEYTAKKEAGFIPCLLDLCTGSGNIAISLTKYLRQCKMTALDISEKAVNKAKINAELNGSADKIEFVNSDLYSNISKECLYDVIVSNPPYISEKDICMLSGEVLEEPHMALFGGESGLLFYDRIARDSKKHLKRDGLLLMEIGYDQALPVSDIMKREGYKNVNIFKDYQGLDRIIRAER